MTKLFYIWTPRDWEDFKSSRRFHPPLCTRWADLAKQEYSAGCIVTVWSGKRHVPIKPVTIH
jgi:hypothetical protein